MRIVLRRAGYLLLLFLLVPAGWWSYAEARQWILRLRAQRLLADVKQLQVKDGTWDDFQRFRAKWGKWGNYQDACDPTYCMYNVGLGTNPPFPLPRWNLDDYPHLSKFVEAVGLRSSDVGAVIVVRHGIVAGKAMVIMVDTPLAKPRVQLMVVTGEGPSVYSASKDRARHPNHGLYMTNREHFIVTFTPDESPSVQAALMDVRLDCLTALRPCDDRKRLLPEAVEEFNSEPETHRWDLPVRCNLPFWVLARDEQAVILGDVVSAKLEPEDDGDSRPSEWSVTLRLRLVMKGKLAWPADKPIGISVYDDRVAPVKGGLFPYTSLLIAGKPMADWYMGAILSVPCSAVEASPENMAQAQQGIVKDFSPEPLQER